MVREELANQENSRREGNLKETIESYRRTKSMLKDLTMNLNKSSRLLHEVEPDDTKNLKDNSEV